MQRYQAQAALGLVLNVRNGEVVASLSLPGFDPNRRGEAKDEARRNRIVTDVYELGSVFKTFTVAMALDGDRHPLRPLRHRRAPDGPFPAPRCSCGARADDGRGHLRSLY